MFTPGASFTMHNAKTLLDAGLAAIAGGQAEIDLAELTTVDSAAVAAMLAWQRAAKTVGLALQFPNAPPNLQSLAQLYGVTTLLNLPAIEAPRHPA